MMPRYLLTISVLQLLLVLVAVQARLLDLSRDKDMVVKTHNDERGSARPQAANMIEMTWDMKLQSQAEQWASQCEYARPPRNWNVGSNLYYARDFVHGHGSTRQFIRRSMDSWIRQKTNFVYSSNCGTACLYVQMIHSSVDSIGCAVSTCKSLRTRGRDSQRATILVCIYSPQVDLRNTFPYLEGRPCSRCPNGQFCIDGNRCSKGVASRLPDPYDNQVQALERATTTRYARPSRQLAADSMTSEEIRTIRNLHNDFRRDNGLPTLEWDSYLERWTKHVVNCSIDYPGPIYTYSNFHRFSSVTWFTVHTSAVSTKNHVSLLWFTSKHAWFLMKTAVITPTRFYNSGVSSALYDWQSRADVKPPRTEHKCRTPDDQEACSHWSNMMHSQVTAMACSTKACPGYTRQMICIYDNRADRDNRVAELRRAQVPARRWRTDYNTNNNNRYSERYRDARNYRRRENINRRRGG